MKSIIYYIVIFGLIISCQAKKNNQDLGIIESTPFSKSNYYKYDNGYLRNNPQKLDSFQSYIYTIVEPSEKNKKYPDVIFVNDKLFKKFSLKNNYETRFQREIFIVPNHNISRISFNTYYRE